MTIAANLPARRRGASSRRMAAAWAGLAVISCGAIFGFFFAWVSSTMWGLDIADPRIAIAAMQAMNASVRNPAFASVFFGAPIIMLVAALTAYGARYSESATTLLIGAALYMIGVVAITVSFNVPLNETLAAIEVPRDRDAAHVFWNGYSTPWQAYNQIRTIISGVVLAMAARALYLTASVATLR